jgi:hypothetical protein
MRASRISAVGIVLASVFVAAGSPASGAPAGCPLPQFGPGRDYHPHIDPARFGPRITNPWFPMRVGATWLYAGRSGGDAVLDVVKATRHTRVIAGVRTRVVQDRVFAGGLLEETTSDYYAQDECGNVWYFGEDTAELNARGQVTSREGTWHAGVDGAQPGVVMQAHPQLDRRFRQEWYAGHAEDTYVLRERGVTVTVRAGTFRGALRTAETSRLEPNVVDNKYYVRGIGEVREVAVRGPHETLGLVEVLR